MVWMWWDGLVSLGDWKVDIGFFTNGSSNLLNSNLTPEVTPDLKI
jgi:hypothetical protein